MPSTRTQASSQQLLRDLCKSIDPAALDVALSKISNSTADDLLRELNAAAVLKPIGSKKKESVDSGSPRPAKIKKPPGKTRKRMKKNPYTTKKRRAAKGTKKNDGQSEEGGGQAGSSANPGEPPSSPPIDPNLVKQGGKVFFETVRQPAIPQNVLVGAINQFPTLGSPTSKGLPNPESMCYRNSVLQAVFHTPGFYRYLGKMHKDCALSRDRCLVCALQALAHVYWSSTELEPSAPGRVPGPGSLVGVFTGACKAQLPDTATAALRREVRKDLMADGHDFLQYLFDHLRGQALPSDDATFADTFDLKAETSWTCDTCGNTSTRTIPAPAVGLEVNITAGQKRSLIELIRQFSFTEQRSVFCEGSAQCSQEYQAAKDEQKKKGVGSVADGPARKVTKQLIGTLPEVLVVCLRRFVTKWRKDGNGKKESVAAKLRDEVPFDEHLDLSEFTKDGQNARYRLDGVVTHLGDRLRSGHYIAVVRKATGEGFSVINDDIPAGEGEGDGECDEIWTPQTLGSSKGDAYILVYSKVAKEG